MKESFSSLNLAAQQSQNSDFGDKNSSIAKGELKETQPETDQAQKEDSDSWGEVEFQSAVDESKTINNFNEVPLSAPKAEDLLPNLDDLIFTTEDPT